MSLPKKFKTPQAGEWVQPCIKNYLFQCCDCDLIHSMDFRIYKGRVQFRCYRVNEDGKRIKPHITYILPSFRKKIKGKLPA